MSETAHDGRYASRVLATVASGLVSLVLHGSVLAAALYWIDPTPGAIEIPTEAISIEFIETEILEAVATSAALETAPAPSSVQSDAGELVESAASASNLQPVGNTDQVVAKEPDVADVQAETPLGVEVLQGASETEQPSGMEKPGQPRRETKEQKRPVKTAKLTDPSETRENDSPQKKKGAAQSRATKGAAASTGRVSASAGSSVNYAALVRARVAARKPAGGGRRGTVVVSFGVTRSGGLSFASIARSSGDAGLDRSVLSAVRGAGPFPTPPPGARLSFAIPFYFK